MKLKESGNQFFALINTPTTLANATDPTMVVYDLLITPFFAVVAGATP